MCKELLANTIIENYAYELEAACFVSFGQPRALPSP